MLLMGGDHSGWVSACLILEKIVFPAGGDKDDKPEKPKTQRH